MTDSTAGAAVFSAEVLLSLGIEGSTSIFSGLTVAGVDVESFAAGSVLVVAALGSAAVEAAGSGSGADAEAGSDLAGSLSAEVEETVVVARVGTVEVEEAVAAGAEEVTVVVEEDCGAVLAAASGLDMLTAPL